MCPQTGSPDPAQRSHRPRGVLQGACCHRLRQAAPGPGLSHLELWITDQHVNIGSPAAGAPGRKKQIQSLQVFFKFFLYSEKLADVLVPFLRRPEHLGVTLRLIGQHVYLWF